MDINVTTPKTEIANAAREAEDVKRAGGGGRYFRRFPWSQRPDVRCGDRVYYVEDGYVRGFAVADEVVSEHGVQTCDTTGRTWPEGLYVFMRASTWQWIEPIPMRGFQGFRYAHASSAPTKIIGGWLDPRPEA